MCIDILSHLCFFSKRGNENLTLVKSLPEIFNFFSNSYRKKEKFPPADLTSLRTSFLVRYSIFGKYDFPKITNNNLWSLTIESGFFYASWSNFNQRPCIVLTHILGFNLSLFSLIIFLTFTLSNNKFIKFRRYQYLRFTLSD